jgi:hypothetical protein
LEKQRFGFELSLNYNPSKIWKINSSFNLFNTKTTGDFMYTNSQNKVIIQNLDNEAFSWFTLSISFNIALQSGVAGERYVFWTEQNSAG